MTNSSILEEIKRRYYRNGQLNQNPKSEPYLEIYVLWIKVYELTPNVECATPHIIGLIFQKIELSRLIYTPKKVNMW